MLIHCFPKCLDFYYLPEPGIYVALCSMRFDLKLKKKFFFWIKTILFIAPKKSIFFESDLWLTHFFFNH